MYMSKCIVRRAWMQPTKVQFNFFLPRRDSVTHCVLIEGSLTTSNSIRPWVDFASEAYWLLHNSLNQFEWRQIGAQSGCTVGAGIYITAKSSIIASMSHNDRRQFQQIKPAAWDVIALFTLSCGDSNPCEYKSSNGITLLPRGRFFQLNLATVRGITIVSMTCGLSSTQCSLIGVVPKVWSVIGGQERKVVYRWWADRSPRPRLVPCFSFFFWRQGCQDLALLIDADYQYVMSLRLLHWTYS
jgi:hypothetical protein